MHQVLRYSRKKYSSTSNHKLSPSSPKKYLILQKFSNAKPILIRQSTPLLSDVAKSVPNHIIYDKQTLYMEVQDLKKTIHKLINENSRLKTRISIFQTSQSRIQKGRYSEQSEDRKVPENELLVYSSHLDALKNEVLKRQLRQLKMELELQKKENARIKHTIKYSKANQLELENRTLIEQNKHLYNLYEQAKAKANNESSQYLQYEMLENKMQKLVKQNKNYLAQIENLTIEIMNLQSQLRKQKVLSKSHDFGSMRKISEEKRGSMKIKDIIDFKKLQNSSSIIDSKLHSARAKQRALQSSFKAHHLHIQTIRKNHIFAGQMPQRLDQNRNSSFSVESSQRTELMDENIKLKSKLSLTECKLNQLQEKSVLNNSTHRQPKTFDIEPCFEEELDKDEDRQIKASLEEMEKITNIQHNNYMVSWPEPIKPTNHPLNQTQVIIEIEPKSKKPKSEINFTPEKSERDEMQDYEMTKNKSQYLKSKRQSDSSINKISNSKILKEIKELLTHRFMCQKYKFVDLKKDIESSNTKKFTYVDVCHMLVNEPFFLNVPYCKALATFIFDIFDKEKSKQQQVIQTSQLLIKLRKIVKDYQEIPKEKQFKLIQRCVHLVRRHGKQLLQQFQQNKRQRNTIPIDKFRDVLGSFQFQRQEIEYMITEVSVSSNDLMHIPFQHVLERFSISQSSRSSKGSKPQVILQREEQHTKMNSRKSLVDRSYESIKHSQRKKDEMKKTSSNRIKWHGDDEGRPHDARSDSQQGISEKVATEGQKAQS